MSKNVPKRRWLAYEIAAVNEGRVPEGRTYLQAASYAHKHGIPWKELRKNVCMWWWRPEEDAILLKGGIVPNRSWEAIRRHKEKLGIPFESAPRFSDFKDYYQSRGLPVPTGVLDEKYHRKSRKNPDNG